MVERRQFRPKSTHSSHLWYDEKAMRDGFKREDELNLYQGGGSKKIQSDSTCRTSERQ